MKKADAVSPLVTAAQTLELELRRYADLAETVAKAPLDSQKGLDRANRAVSDAVEAERRVLEGVKALAEAIQVARERQATATGAINDRAARISERQTDLDALLAKFQAIGTIAHTLNEAAQKVVSYKPDPYDAEGAREVDETLGKIDEGMTECARRAAELDEEARKVEFEDIARQADQLRQQTLSTKNRLTLLRKQRVS